MKMTWWRNLKDKCKNKTFLVFFLLFAIMSPFAVFMPHQTEELAVITALGIDKNDEGQLEVSVLTVAPAGGSTPENQTFQLYSVVGGDISQCILRLSLSIGKQVGLAHCDSIVVGDEILEEGLTPYLDYFMRSSNLLANAFLINAPGGAKELLEVTTSIKNDYNLSLRSIIFHLDDYIFTTQATLDFYYEKLFAENSAFLMPIVEVKNSNDPAFTEEEGNQTASDQSSQSSDSSSSSQGSSEDQSGGGSGGSGSGSSGQSSSQEEKNIKSEGKSVLLIDGKKVRELTSIESYAMSIISKDTSKGIIMAYHVNNEKLRNAKVTMRITETKAKYKALFVNGKPQFHMDLKFVCTLDSIIMDDYKLDDYEATTSYLDDVLNDALKEYLYDITSTLLTNGKELGADFLESYRYFNAYKHKEWETYKQSLEEGEHYLDNMLYTMNIQIKTKI